MLVTAQRTADAAGTAVTESPFTVRSNPDGSYLLTGTNQVEGMLDGSWSVTASRSGYTDGTGTVTVVNGLITAATGSLQLVSQASQTVNIRLTVTPVNLRVELRFGTQPVTTNVTVILLNGTTPVSICAAPPATSTKCTLPAAPNTFFEMTAINPAVYTLAVSSSSSTYRSVSTQVAVVAGQAVQSVVISLSRRVERGVRHRGVVARRRQRARRRPGGDGDRRQPRHTGAQHDPAVPLTTTISGGRYSLSNVPDGFYQVRIVKAGYATWRSGTFRVEAGLNPNVTVQQATVIRASRSVTLTLSSTADPAARSPVRPSR